MSDNPYNMKQHDEFLFECELSGLDYDFAKSFFEGLTLEDLLFGCTSFASLKCISSLFNICREE